MSQDRLLLDTVFIQALLNPRDQYHSPAMQLFPRIKNAQEVWITEAIFMEVGNALSTYDRHKVAAFIQKCYKTDNISNEGFCCEYLSLTVEPEEKPGFCCEYNS